MTRQGTYAGAWKRAIGPRTSGLVESALAAKTGVTCLSYSMILGDMASQLLGIARGRARISVTATSQLPLCLHDTSKTFGLLKYSSALGLGATAYVALFIAQRFLAGSYDVGGAFYASVPRSYGGPLARWAGMHRRCSVGSRRVRSSVSMLATAFMAHYNAPAFLREASGAQIELLTCQGTTR